MTGLFAVIYFLYERILKCENFRGKEIKKIIVDGFLCGGIMLSGLLGSCFIFWPVVKGLQNGKEAFDPSIFQYATHGSFLDVFQGFAIGGLVSTVSLYCGLIFLAFCFYYFLSGRRTFKEKIVSILVVLLMFASCWLVPLDCIWSGLRQVQSFAFRYSFVVTFLVLYLAARGGGDYEIEQKNLGLLHGKIGAKICRDKYNFTKDMQNAIEYHTLGHVNMDKLAKIVYIADKIEDNRKGKDLKYLNELAQKDLDKTMLYLLDTTIVINIKRHKLIHPQSILTRNNLLSK